MHHIKNDTKFKDCCKCLPREMKIDYEYGTNMLIYVLQLIRIMEDDKILAKS